MSEMIERRFWAKVDKRGPEECWPWTATSNLNRGSQRYGMFRVNGKMRRAIRVAVELHSGAEIPSGMVVRHKCDNSICCNPHHLEIGTQKQNVEDMCLRNRPDYTRGCAHHRSKIAESDLHTIELMLTAGMSQRAVGAHFGVSQEPIRNIAKNMGLNYAA